jgi:hypothetical protein
MIVFSRLCTMIVAGKLAFEAVFIVLRALGVREDTATGGGATLGMIAGLAAVVLVATAQDRAEEERFSDGVKLGYNAGRAEARKAAELHRLDGGQDNPSGPFRPS